MSEKTKPKKDLLKQVGKARKKVESEVAAWEKEPLEKSYYYDDAHGYEIYNPDEDDDDEN